METTLRAEVECAEDVRAQLGEGPVWDGVAGVLWWLDIPAGQLYRHDPVSARSKRWAMGSEIGCFALTDGPEILVALADGLHLFDPQTGACRRFGTLAPEAGTNRFNDGKVDPHGRFWVGSIEAAHFAPSGKLYAVDGAGAATVHLEGLRCANGIGWTLDGRRMYFADSMQRVIWSFAFDPEHGQIRDRSVFASFTDTGLPDGLAVDVEGCVWVALWDGGAIVRLSPDGDTLEQIAMPAKRPTSCAFGGDDLKTLYVTSATFGLDAKELALTPNAGGLFRIRTAAAGVPVRRFGAAEQ